MSENAFLHLEDDERRRLSQELYNKIAQNVVAFIVDMGLIVDSPALPFAVRSALSESLLLARQNLQEIVLFCYQLYPPMIDELGLLSSLRIYIEGFSRISGIRVELELPDAYLRLPRDLEVTLFRLVFVSLSAAHKHFESSWSKVRLSTDATEARVTIERELGIEPSLMKARCESDDGGLRSVQERTRQLGGQLILHLDEHRALLEAVFPLSKVFTAAGI